MATPPTTPASKGLTDTSKFPHAVVLAAQESQRLFPQVFASVSLAQWALESAYGKKHLGVYNYFGIKAREGEPFVSFSTKEFFAGKEVTIVAKFRKFDSPLEAFIEHAKLFYRTRSGRKIYAKALAAKTPEDFANALTGVYATDPKYGFKLCSIMTVYNLKQFDLFANV